MALALTVDEFLATAGPILDVRSPGEYLQGHIPGAHSFPLFSDEERATVGTCYKQQGKEQAIELGLKLVGPKLADFVVQAKQLAPNRQVRLHCWRGGMRTSSMAWLLETAGFQAFILEGGYKAFRRWVRNTVGTPKPILTLGGMTGTGKTEVLEALAQQEAQVLDLEGLANHRGSSYGSLGLPNQPSNEQFENLVAWDWSQLNGQQPIWIEAESRRIGTCRVPDELFQQMMGAPVLEILRSQPERISLLVKIYGEANREDLVAATERIRKRLGGQRTQQAINHIRQGNLAEAVAIILAYYDKAYRYDLEKRGTPLYSVDVSGLTPAASATCLIDKAKFYRLGQTVGSTIEPAPQI